MTLSNDEYITQVWMREGAQIQAIKFTTNKGQVFGPMGGKGRMLKDSCGEEQTIDAPNGYQLCGFAGRAGDHITALALRWGPVPGSK